MSTIELAAAAFGVLSVLLTVKRNIWCWPTGLAMVSLYALVFWQARLYSSMALQGVFFVLCLYGWYFWLRGKDHGPARITLHHARYYGGWLAAGAVGTALLGALASRTTEAAVPFWDAAVTVLSLIAQWLMSRKDIGAWGFWISVDLLAVGLFSSQGLAITAGLYFLFLCLATAGLFEWRRAMREEGSAIA